MATLSSVDLHDAPFSVAVVDDDPKLRTRLAMQLGEAARAAAFANLSSFEQRSPGGPIVLVLGPSYAGEDGLSEVARMTRGRPDVSAVMVVPELSTEVLQQAIRAGISDVVPMSTDSGQLLEAVKRAGDRAQPQPPAALTTVAPASSLGRGRTITVFSTKGGAGKSFVATNLAAVLSRRNEKPVALVDADLQFGDVAVMLGIVPQHTIIDAVNQIDRLDEQLLRSLLVKHEPSGMLVLPAPIEPAFADSVSLAHMQRILEVLTSFCSYVVIDTPARFDDIVLGLLEATDDIVLMAGMDIPHIKNTKIGLQTLRLLHIPASKVKLTLNRANSKVKLDIADVERTLQMKADCLLPSEIAVPQSINKGVPVVIDSPRSGVARNLERMADLFAVADEAQGGR
ncbi:MAG TPA: P-loop NTPase [Acidimicrobiales bacterium]